MKTKQRFSITQTVWIAVMLILVLSANGKTKKFDNTTRVSFGKAQVYNDADVPAEAIDLGLPSGTLWASYNLGATKPEDFGDYFAWGEMKGYKSGKIDFSMSTYNWCTVNQNELDLENDVAYMSWGNGWRIPNREQVQELLDNCSWEWTTVNDVDGYKITGSNGNYIFLPAAGMYFDTTFGAANLRGDYWSRSLMDGNSSFSYRMYFTKNIRGVNYANREYGLSIRPVKNPSAENESIWSLVTDNGDQFPMSRVGMLVAVDESSFFSVLDINGNVLADEVLRVHFVNIDPVSVKSISIEKSQNILKRYVNNELTLIGAKGTVNVYSVDGVKMLTIYADGQETVINVSSLPSGTYVVNCGNQSFKFNKK